MPSISLSRGAIVLCGGASTRIGRDKALLPFGSGETLLERVVRLVGEAVPHDPIVCVAAAEQSLPPLAADVQVVRDVERYGGPLAGLALGMAALGSRADTVFICGCDAPLLVPAFVTRLFDLLGDHQIAAPYDGARFHPLAAVYRSDVLPIAESLLVAGERSLQAFLERCDTLRVSMDELRSVDPSLASLENCNTLVDYQRALEQGFLPHVEP